MAMEVLLHDCCIQRHVLGATLCALYILEISRVNEWFWKFNKNLSISRNLSIRSIQTLFLMAASERIANSKSENPLSISKLVSQIEMNF